MKASVQNLFLVLACTGLLAMPAVSQTFTNLYRFAGFPTDGANPHSGLILSGNTLYGTTYGGGNSGSSLGTVFKINVDSSGYTLLKSFAGGGEGALPSAGLIVSGNKIYGATEQGGSANKGTVFAMNIDGTGFTNLYSFTGNDGATPYVVLLLSGNILYGTTVSGGGSDLGTVFAMNTDGTGFTNLHSFTGGSNGAYPKSALILSGNSLYGTTEQGGNSGLGTVFAMNTDGTGFTNLHSFTGNDGAYPTATLILSGNTLYGTANQRGSSGAGTVFKLNTDSLGFTNLHSFSYLSGGGPQAGLILSGNMLYGTTTYYSGGGGTVFAIKTDGAGFTNLYSFTGGSDGSNPECALVISGNKLYGTADLGGNSGHGTVFALSLPPPSLSIALSSVPRLTTNSSGIFTIATNYPVGSNPLSVAAFTNVDGKVDLVCANYSGNSLTLLTNNGSGIFSSNTTITGFNNPYSVVAADVNGDSKMDLVVANNGNDTLTLMTNDGSGGFHLYATLNVGPYVVGVGSADLNNDSKVDLFCANSDGNLIYVFINNGNGNFSGTSNHFVGLNSYPRFVLAADVNGDGYLDLICADSTVPGKVSVFMNNGSGGFPSSSANYNTSGNQPNSVAAADVNGDGKVDLIAVNSGGNTFSVLTNNGSGGFALALLQVEGNSPQSVAAFTNADGKLNLALANSSDNSVTVLTNNGSGIFTPACTNYLGNNSSPSFVTVADVNGDGWVDLISANPGVNTLTVLTNTPAVQTHTGNGVVLTWPSPSAGFVLQQNNNLATTNWTNSSFSINDNGTTKSVTNSPAAGNLFFRLKQ